MIDYIKLPEYVGEKSSQVALKLKILNLIVTQMFHLLVDQHVSKFLKAV